MSGGGVGQQCAWKGWDSQRATQSEYERAFNSRGAYGGSAKVKCDYCGNSYAATHNKCPSCGARK